MDFSPLEVDTAFSLGNQLGLGYAPYLDVAPDPSAETAIACAVRDGRVLVCRGEYVTVLRDKHGELVAIGGPIIGNGARAVDVTDLIEDARELPYELAARSVCWHQGA